MRKQVFGRKLKRDANERKALLKGLLNDLVLKERITITEEKAKAIRGQMEKLITKAKKKGTAATKLLQPYLSLKALDKVMHDLSVRFASRPGGYVRIVKLTERFGDHARMAVIEWVVGPEEKKEIVEPVIVGSKVTKQSSTKKKATKKVVSKKKEEK